MNGNILQPVVFVTQINMILGITVNLCSLCLSISYFIIIKRTKSALVD